MRRPATHHVIAYVLLLGGLVAYLGWAFTHYTLGTPRQWYMADMYDSETVKAFEAPMGGVPEGAIARSHVTNYANRADGQHLENPYAGEPGLEEVGARAFQTWCAPCHGAQGEGRGPVTDNNPAEGRNRYMVPAPKLIGPGGMAALRSDGHIYLTIRNGSAIMRGYDWAMDDREMWAIVAWLRTQPGSQYTPAP